MIDFEHLELPTNAEVTAVSTANHLFAVFYDDVGIFGREIFISGSKS